MLLPNAGETLCITWRLSDGSPSDILGACVSDGEIGVSGRDSHRLMVDSARNC